MREFREFINTTVPDDEKEQIIRDFEILEIDGSIGDSVIRQTAERWASETGMGFNIFIFNNIAMECYRYFAEKYLEQKVIDENRRFF
jgi:hypothetical protein